MFERCTARDVCKYEYFCTTGDKKTSNVFFSKNILFYNVIIYFYIVIIL